MTPTRELAGWSASTAAHTLGPFPMVVPASVDLPAIEAQLRATHVSAPDDETAALEHAVATARAKGHDIYFVVLSEQYGSTSYRDIATELQKHTGGTVVVFGPNDLGSASDDFSRVTLEQARDNLPVSTPSQAANTYVDRITSDQVSWTAITLVLIVVVVIGAVIARFTQLRNRRKSSPDASVDDGTEADRGADRGEADPVVERRGQQGIRADVPRTDSEPSSAQTGTTPSGSESTGP